MKMKPDKDNRKETQRTCPTLFIAAPASGQGKTTVTAGLARLHSRAGRRVRVFKCGPDFLDPQILAVASGSRVYNLDPWMCGDDDAAARLFAAAGEADLILIEGVMGLYDGEPDYRCPSPAGSTIARRFGAPILAVIDASAMAQTFGAVALGLAAYDPGLAFAGVLANRVAGARHAAMLRSSLPAALPWYGHLPTESDAALPERHLGLLQATEIADLEARLDRIADLLANTDAAQLPASSFFDDAAAATVPPLLQGKTIAIARDAAFGFIYPANVDCLLSLGARLAFFSPLADEPLPHCDALWLPGGYPELHAPQLASNDELQASLRAHHEDGKPTLAECGGMMALFDRLIDARGGSYRMAGLIPGEVAMRKKLSAIGIQAASLPEGTLRGHTFHHSSASTPLQPIARAHTASGAAGEGIYRNGRLTASYLHFYFPSNPMAVAALFGAYQGPA